MDVRSSAFLNTSPLPRHYTCDGDALSPPLEWAGAPPEVKSFVLICEDPDAPRSPFFHWGVYNIPAHVQDLPAGFHAAPYDTIKEARNDAGHLGYYPACPPAGELEHHYHFHLWALNVERLDFHGTPTVEELKQRAEEHVIDRAEVQAWYGR